MNDPSSIKEERELTILMRENNKIREKNNKISPFVWEMVDRINKLCR